jgi:hypothetical protein
VLVLTALLSTWPFFARGHPVIVDVWPHLARLKIFYEAIRGGFWPLYTFMLYCGFPALRFYSPLFYFFGGLLALLTGGNLLLALRLLLLLAHLLSGWAMFTLLRRRTGETTGAAFGTMVYLLIPWRLVYLCGSANFPPALTYLFLPLAFLALDRIIERREPKYAVLLGLWVALLSLSHLVYAVFAVVFLLLFAIFGRVQRSGPTRAVGGLLPLLGLAALVAFGLSAFFTVPFLVEYRSHVFPLPGLNLGVPDVFVLLGIKRRAGGYGGDYLGVSVLLTLVLALIGLVVQKRGRSQLPVWLSLALTLGLTFLPAVLKEKQAIITAGLPPERCLLFFVFFAALLAPSACEFLHAALRRSGSPVLIAFLVLAVSVLADCLPQLYHGNYGSSREFLAVREELYRTIVTQPHTRTLDINMPEAYIADTRRICRHPSAAFVYGDLASPLGPPYHQFAPRSMLYVYPWVDCVAGDIGNTGLDTLTTRTLNALYLMGVSHVITMPGLKRAAPGNTGGDSLVLKRRLDWDSRFVRARADPPLALGRSHAGLGLVSNRVLPLPEDTLVQKSTFMIAQNWSRLLDTLAFNYEHNQMSFIPARAGHRPESLPGLPVLKVMSTRTRNQDVEMEFDVSTDCFFRLAVSYYPELRILLDGRSVPFFETSDHFIWFPCPAGTHRVRAVAVMTPVRQVTTAVSVISLVLVGLLLARGRRRTKRRNGAATVDH